MKKPEFALILEDCLQRLDRGESLPGLLAAYPDQADELKPLLLVAMASRAFPVPVPSQTAQRLGRNQMLAEMNQREIKNAFRNKAAIPLSSRLLGGLVSALRAKGFTLPAYSYRLAMISLVLILSGGYFTLSASASSQPGDLLYQLRLGLEQAGLAASESSGDEEYLLIIPPQPWEFGETVWALEGISSAYQIEQGSIPDFLLSDQGEFLTADQQGQQAEKALKAAEREAEKALKAADKQADKNLAKAEKEAERDLKEAEKQAAAAERDAKKEAAQAEKEAERDLKEAEKQAAAVEKESKKEAAQAEKEAERDLREEEKDAAETSRGTRKPAKDLDQGRKERAKEAKKNNK